MTTRTFSFAFATLFFAACVDEPTLGEQRQASSCDGADSYYDENGEEVICVYTDEPGDPIDPCFLFPALCGGGYDDGGDTCTNPYGCNDGGDDSGGGGDPVEDERARRDRMFGRALGRSRCYLNNAQCASVVGWNGGCENPKAMLNYLNDNGQLRQEGAPPVRSDGIVPAADTSGKGTSAVVRFFDGWYAGDAMWQVRAMLHEMGHVCEPPGTNNTDTQPFQDAIAACMAQPAVQACVNADVNGNTY